MIFIHFLLFQLWLAGISCASGETEYRKVNLKGEACHTYGKECHKVIAFHLKYLWR